MVKAKVKKPVRLVDYAREIALHHAVGLWHHGDTSQTVVAAAEVYLKFLKGEEG